MAYNVGTAFITVAPAFKGFQLAAAAEAKKLRPIKIPVEYDMPNLPAIAPGKPVKVPVELDQGSFDRNVKTRLAAAMKALPTTIGLNADATDAERELGVLRTQLENLSKAEIGVDISDDAALHELDYIRAELDRLGASSPSVRVRVDAAAAVAELAAVQAEVDKLDGETAKVDVKADGVAAATKGFGFLATAIVGLAPVAVPALAAVTAGVGLLGSALITAGAAGGVFGAAVVGQIVEMKKSEKIIAASNKSLDAAKASQQVYKTALDATTKGTPAYTAALKALHTAQTKTAQAQGKVNSQQHAFNQQFGPAAKGLENLKTAWSGFLGATRTVTVGVIGKGLNIAAGLLPRLVPLANAAGRAVGGLLDDFRRFTKTKSFDGILRFFQHFGPAAITSFGHITGNVVMGVFNLFRSFAPYQKRFLSGFEAITRSFSRWSAGFGKSNGFQRFMGYVQKTLPSVKALFGNLIEFIGKFVVALGPLGGVEIKVLTSLLQGLNKLSPKALTAIAVGITGVVLGLKAWAIGTKVVEAVTGTFAVVQGVSLALMGGEAAALEGNVIAMKAYAVTTKIAAAGQWLLNAAMDANPIGIVVVALAALAVGLVIAYRKSETFRNIVNGAWSAIKTAVAKAWAGIKVALSAFAGYLTKYLMPAITWLWTKVVKPYFKAIGTAIKVAWVIIRLVFQLWRAYMVLVLFPAITALWTKVVKPTFRAVGASIRAGWIVVRTIFQAWWSYMTNILFPVIRFLWVNVVKPVMDKVGSGIKATWNNVIKPVFIALKNFIHDYVAPAFRKGIDAITAIWDGLRAAISVPVRFVIDTVWNNGLRKVINSIPGVTDLPKITFGGSSGSGSKTTTPHGGHTAPTTSAAQGGVLPGFTPGRDVHHFYSPTGGHLHLSGGEPIMRPEFGKVVGKGWVDHMNTAARSGGTKAVKKALYQSGIYHFASGGIYRPVAAGAIGSNGVHDQWTGFPAVDFVVGSGTPVHAAASGRVTVSEDLATSYGHWIKIASAHFQSLYAHLAKRLVGVGASVAGGQLIGYSDSTGNSTGPHLHFGVSGANVLDFVRASTNYGSAGSAAGAGSSGGGGGVLGAVWQHLQGLVGGLAGKLGGWVSHLTHMGPWGKLLTGAIKSMVGGVKDFATGKLSGALSAVGHVASNGLGLNGGTVGQIVKGLAQRSGWGSGAEWAALSNIISSESGWNPKAQNPSSTAYGLFQFLNSTWATVGGHKTSDANLQTQYGLRYIANRYHDPIGAWNFHKAHGWYDDGGYIPPGVSTVFNGTGKPEPVLTSAQWADIRKAGGTGQAQAMPGVHMEHVHVTDLNELVRIQKAAQHKALTMARLA